MPRSARSFTPRSAPAREVAVAFALARAHRPRQYPARLAVGAGARRGGAAGAAAAGVRRRPRPHRCRLRLRGGDQRRRAGALDRRRLDRRQGDARPADGAARRGASGLRLRAPHGLQRAGAFRRAGAARADHPSPPLVCAGRRAVTASAGRAETALPIIAKPVASASAGGRLFRPVRAGFAQPLRGRRCFTFPSFVELLRSRPRAAVLGRRAGAGACCGRWFPRCSIRRRRATCRCVLAVGHEFQLGTYLGPPLAFWLAELAFRSPAALFGVYLLSQVCVVVTYWAVFALGRSHRRRAACRAGGAADGRRRGLHGADAGIRAGRCWRCRCGRSFCCITGGRSARNGADTGWLLAIEIGLLLLTTYAGLIWSACCVLFTLAERAGRAHAAHLRSVDRGCRRRSSCCFRI